jgi:hypothetical protein
VGGCVFLAGVCGSRPPNLGKAQSALHPLPPGEREIWIVVSVVRALGFKVGRLEQRVNVRLRIAKPRNMRIMFSGEIKCSSQTRRVPEYITALPPVSYFFFGTPSKHQQLC